MKCFHYAITTSPTVAAAGTGLRCLPHMYVACLCVNIYHMCNIMSQTTIQLQSISSFWSFVGQATASKYNSFVLSRWRKSGRYSAFASYSYQLPSCRTVCSMTITYLFIQDETDSLLQLQLAWPTCC